MWWLGKTCRVPGCTEKHKAHFCKWCKNQNSNHFARDCWYGPGGKMAANNKHSALPRQSPAHHGLPATVKAILAHLATDHGRAKEPKDVIRLLGWLQSAMGGQGISSTSFRGVEKVLTSTFINETLPVLCDVLSKSDLSFPLQPPSSHSHSGTEAHMTARECFVLIGAGFLCLHKHGHSGSLNFDRPFDNHTPSGKAKLQCFIHYLDTMARAIKEGNTAETERMVIFRALHSPAAGLQEWARSTTPLMDVHLMNGKDASIFDSKGIRGDLANAHIGGGTLGNGAVQEEILFSIEPECLVARHLFPRAMQPTEAFMIVGSKTFSRTSGYGRETLRFAGSAHDTATMKHTNGHSVLGKTVVAFDAVNFGKHGGDQQYDERCVLRELNKAHTAFHCNGLTIVGGLPFATGNWGCGVFGGDPQWKFLIQWCAASRAGRRLHYYPRDEKSLVGSKNFMHDLKNAGCSTVGHLVQLMCDGRTRGAIGRRVSAFDAIRGALAQQTRPASRQMSHSLPPRRQQPRKRTLSNSPPAPPTRRHHGGIIDTNKAEAKERETTLLASAQKSGDSKIDHIFQYVPVKRTRPSEVLLAGSFDGWHGRYPMFWSAEHNSFVLPMPLPAGRHMYKFIVDGVWTCAGRQPSARDSSNNLNNVVNVG
ncbi:unnamed protein product [Vitrella brassicaformis CCMP3155]|uniref:poly(ADP-ribose) glycohydrolase n=2 Tax=Vitrella brassicaformis TaxID=1169539 RepID=A0A0G4GMK9_VITBC|nr:unnamed protein product [Vitrella brassicaformis CCMP3155]|mmetsp:Transcript_29407/g.85087  ORF Transcript_29407/g.85087 Transcript_29407/m.85087 type:complete len:649 (+) Transcript_29407:458-2404(+)|eukprot:CEM31365.1 unnamed protein product [Vitrella brassicaformis CCMP3155]